MKSEQEKVKEIRESYKNKYEILKDGRVHCIEVGFFWSTEKKAKQYYLELYQVVSKMKIYEPSGEVGFHNITVECKLKVNSDIDTVEKGEKFIREQEINLPEGYSFGIKTIYDTEPIILDTDNVTTEYLEEAQKTRTRNNVDKCYERSYLIVRAPGEALVVDKTIGF